MTRTDLTTMNKVNLQEVAKSMNLDFTSKTTKTQLIEAIVAYVDSQPAAEPQPEEAPAPAVDESPAVDETPAPKADRKPSAKTEAKKLERQVRRDSIANEAEALGFIVKIWDKIPNLVALYAPTGKETGRKTTPVAEIRIVNVSAGNPGGYVFNMKESAVPEGIKYTKYNNYNLAATIPADLNLVDSLINHLVPQLTPATDAK